MTALKRMRPRKCCACRKGWVLEVWRIGRAGRWGVIARLFTVRKTAAINSSGGRGPVAEIRWGASTAEAVLDNLKGTAASITAKGAEEHWLRRRRRSAWRVWQCWDAWQWELVWSSGMRNRQNLKLSLKYMTGKWKLSSHLSVVLNESWPIVIKWEVTSLISNETKSYIKEKVQWKQNYKMKFNWSFRHLNCYRNIFCKYCLLNFPNIKIIKHFDKKSIWYGSCTLLVNYF